MRAQQSIQAGKAIVDFNADLTHMLCEALLMPPLRNSNGSFSQVVGRFSLKHPSLFGGNEKLDVSWDKGLNDSQMIDAFRRPQFGRFSQ